MNNSDLVIIQLDRPRVLRFTFTAMQTLVSLTGKSIEELDEEGFQISEFDKLKAAIYCGLLKDAKEHSETLSLEKVEDLLDEAPHFSHIYEQFVKAWQFAFGVNPQQFEGNQEPPAKKSAAGK